MMKTKTWLNFLRKLTFSTIYLVKKVNLRKKSLMNKALTWWRSLTAPQRRKYCYKVFTTMKSPSKLDNTEIQKIYLNYGND